MRKWGVSGGGMWVEVGGSDKRSVHLGGMKQPMQ
jgi:hypothetical protein